MIFLTNIELLWKLIFVRVNRIKFVARIRNYEYVELASLGNIHSQQKRIVAQTRWKPSRSRCENGH